MNITKDEYCRLCAELKPHNKLVNLQIDDDMCEKIVSKLSRFNIVMDFNESILPKTVCFLCTKSLDRAFTFITAVEDAQAALSDFILIQINNNENNPKEENIFVESPDEGTPEVGELAINIKDEHHFYVPIDVKNEDFDVNVNSEGCTNVKINPTVDEIPNLKNEDNINVKVESVSFKSPERNSDDTNASNDDDIMTKNIGNKPLNLNNYDMDVSMESDINNKEKYMSVEHPNVNNDKNKNRKSKLNNKKKNIRIKSKSKDSNSEPLGNAETSTDYINEQIDRMAAVSVQHIKKTWRDFCWRCSFCETQFPNVKELRNHSMEYHNTCNPYMCPDCNTKRLRLDGFLKHVRTHRKYLHYSCYICYMKFSNPVAMRRHKYTHKDTDYICKGCNTYFETEDELNQHVNTFFKNMWKKKISNKSPNNNFACTMCNKSYISSSGLRYHLVTHDRKRDQICEICGKGFYKKNYLRDHMNLHSDTDVKRYPCEICKHSFKSIYRLRYHAKVHSGIKPFTCNECGKCFRLKGQLANHLLTHTDSLPHTCTYCNKGFRGSTNLKNHMLQHTGVKPYSCEICPRDFTNWPNWNKHMKRKHGIETAKRKRTSEGPHAVDPVTGKVIYPEQEKALEWKKKMKEPIRSKTKQDRSMIKKTRKVVICQEKLVTNESVVETAVCETLLPV